MTRADSTPRRGRPFLLAGAILLVGLVDEVAGLTGSDVWQWLVAAGLAVAVELHRLASTLEGRADRTVRVLTVIAACGAGLYLGATVSFLAADAGGVGLPTPLQGLFVGGALSLLVGIILAATWIGGAMIRGGAGSRVTGGLVLLVGMLFLSPVPALLAVDVPDAIPLSGVAALAAVLAVLGRMMPAVHRDARLAGWGDTVPGPCRRPFDDGRPRGDLAVGPPGPPLPRGSDPR